MSQRNRPRVPTQKAKPTRARLARAAGVSAREDPLRPVATLDTPELLALLLGKGSLAGDAVPCAHRLLEAFGSVHNVTKASPKVLQQEGLSLAQARLLSASFELARRNERERWWAEGLELAGPSRVAEYVHARYAEPPEETLGVFYLDFRRRLLGERVLSRGRRYHDSVLPSPILKHALLLGAAGMVLFRTVASDPLFLVSPEDRLFATRLGESSEVVGLKLLDLLLVAADGRWASAVHPKGAPAKARDAREPTAPRVRTGPAPTTQEAQAAAG